MPYPQFDRSQLVIRPLPERTHDLTLDHQLPLDSPLIEPVDPVMLGLGAELTHVRQRGAAAIFMCGGHVIRAGVARHLIDLMERRLVTHLAFNGAGPIHDWELALIGATSESVARYVRSGEFGLWRETGDMNAVIADGYRAGLGYGEALGRHIWERGFPNRELSVVAQAWRLGVPVTVHIGIGYDILHEHPNCDAEALGGASYRDFLTYCHAVGRLEGGAMYNFGTAVMGPEVYLKALAMARNVAHQRGGKIAHFQTAVFDLMELEGDTHKEQPKSHPQYYYRPWKTILVRTVADGGRSVYVQSEHRRSIPQLRAGALAAGADSPSSPGVSA